MLYDIGFLAVGFVLVAAGGHLFVDASIHIARVLRVSRMVIGGSIVSLATTVPELVVSATASVMGDSGIALGNAVGSVIANIGLIIGTVALVTRVSVDREAYITRSVWMCGAAVLVILFSWNGVISRPFAAVLFVLSLAYFYDDYRRARKHRSHVPPEDEVEPAADGTTSRSVWLFVLGAVLIAVGSQLLVTSGIGLATALGVSSVVIGLSVVAVGTSLPELVTGVSSALKGVPDLSIGNILGANLLNLAMIVGLSGVIHPLTVESFTQRYSYSWLVLFILLIVVMLGRTGVLGKRGGFALLSLYFVYVTGLVAYALTGLQS